MADRYATASKETEWNQSTDRGEGSSKSERGKDKKRDKRPDKPKNKIDKGKKMQSKNLKEVLAITNKDGRSSKGYSNRSKQK